MRTIRNASFALVLLLILGVQLGVLKADGPCPGTNGNWCECTGTNQAHLSWSSGTMTCPDQGTNYCPIACTACYGTDVSGTPACDAQARTVDCTCAPPG